MSLIEGVGDEVTDFFIVMTVLLVGWLAWCSTSIAEQPLIRTVLILRDRASTRIASLISILQDAGRPHSSETAEEETLETASNNSDTTQSSCPNAANVDTSESLQEIPRSPESTTAEEVLIEAMDSFGNADRSLLQRTAKADNTDALDQTTSSTSECASEESISDNNSPLNNEITIKLKFINDDQKVVTFSSLKEMLGDFKRRHFQMELEPIPPACLICPTTRVLLVLAYPSSAGTLMARLT